VTANKFATEAFMDQVARKRGIDPLAFRLEPLKNTPRAYKAVERVAQMADWGRKREGRALGLASGVRLRQTPFTSDRAKKALG
jgi:isoquinoline 1-oxidoreductase subunit beta